MKKKIITLSIIIIVTFFAYFFIIKGMYPDITKRGLFGDMFGGLNTLFSGLAFIGVIYAIILQKEELGLQREELKLTREELKKSAEAQIKSGKALSVQVKQMEKSARLNALTTLIDFYTRIAASYGEDFLSARREIQKAEIYIHEVKQILEESNK